MKNEKFKTLDGTEIKFTGEELVICDGDGPVALAGVVGGLNSGVSEDTKDLFINRPILLRILFAKLHANLVLIQTLLIGSQEAQILLK